jgi:hypothetical protein
MNYLTKQVQRAASFLRRTFIPVSGVATCRLLSKGVSAVAIEQTDETDTVMHRLRSEPRGALGLCSVRSVIPLLARSANIRGPDCLLSAWLGLARGCPLQLEVGSGAWWCGTGWRLGRGDNGDCWPIRSSCNCFQRCGLRHQLPASRPRTYDRPAVPAWPLRSLAGPACPCCASAARRAKRLCLGRHRADAGIRHG